jgi:IS4 transposase
LDPERQLVRRVLACEDAYANERTALPRLLEEVTAGQCWIADRSFCTCEFLGGIVERGAAFVIRQHGQLKGELSGRAGGVRRTATGRVREQGLRISAGGQERTFRRITVELDEPTRDGDRELHVLTNLPPQIPAAEIARLYRERWSIETAFMHLATVLRSEIDTLAYPPAALLGFAVGLVLYNVLRTLEAAVRAAQPRATLGRRLSLYYLGEEIAAVARGMAIAIPPAEWIALRDVAAPAWRTNLLQVAARVEVARYFTHPPSTKRKTSTRRPGSRREAHNSTYRLLKNSKIS